MTTTPAQTPSWAQVIRDAIDGRLYDLHTAMPGIVDSYDASTGLASVKPALRRTYASESAAVDLPALSQVPVLMPRCNAGATYISLPLQKGDPVTLIFSERSLDIWKSTDGTGAVNPSDPRKHHLSDAYCFPGGYPAAATPMSKGSASDLLVVHNAASMTIAKNGDVTLDTGNNASITMTAAGKCKITNATGELVATLSKLIADVQQLFTDIGNATTLTQLGNQPLIMASYAADTATLSTDKTTLDTFKA